MANDLPHGFILQPDFFDEPEEQTLIDTIRKAPLAACACMVWRPNGARRSLVALFTRYIQVVAGRAAAGRTRGLRSRAAVLAGITAEEFAKALVTEYGLGAGIGWHRDAPHFGMVAGISLGGKCRMRFQRGQGKGSCHPPAAILTPRSVYLLTGEARNTRQHSIPPEELRAHRWSITLRTIRRIPGSSP